MTQRKYSAWKKQLQKRLKEVAELRDAIRDDLSEMGQLHEECERAYEDMERAVDALSELT